MDTFQANGAPFSNISPFIATVPKCRRVTVFLTRSTTQCSTHRTEMALTSSMKPTFGQGLNFAAARLAQEATRWWGHGKKYWLASLAAGDCCCPVTLHYYSSPPDGQATSHGKSFVSSQPLNCHNVCHKGHFQPVKTKFPFPDLLPFFPLSLKTKSASCIGRTGERFLPTPEVGFTVFYHVILVLDTLLCILFSLKYISVKSDTEFGIRASMNYMASTYSPMLQHVTPVSDCSLSPWHLKPCWSYRLSMAARVVSQQHLPEVFILAAWFEYFIFLLGRYTLVLSTFADLQDLTTEVPKQSDLIRST